MVEVLQITEILRLKERNMTIDMISTNKTYKRVLKNFIMVINLNFLERSTNI